MVMIAADSSDDIKLIVRNKEFPVKVWNTRSSYFEESIPVSGTGSHSIRHVRGKILHTGWIKVGEWLTTAQLAELNDIMRPTVSFKVVIYYQGEPLGQHNCGLLGIERLSDGIEYHYSVMAGSDNLEI